MTSKIKLITATTAPFTESGDLDLPGTRTLFESLRASGIEYVFTPGTTAEFTSLTDAERLDIIAAALDVFGSDGVFAHVGAATSRQAVRLATQAVALGTTRLAAITPYFVTAGPEAVEGYYRDLAQAAPAAAIYVYVFPDRATTQVSPETLGRLARIPGVAGVKLSGMSTDTVATYIAAAPEGFEVYSGNDREVIELAARGASGIVSGISTVYPDLFVEVVSRLNAGEDASALQPTIDEVVASVAGGDIKLIKAGVAFRGLPSGPTRVALDGPSQDALTKLSAAVDSTMGVSR